MPNSLSPHPSEDWDHAESIVDSPVTSTASAPNRVVFPSRGGALDDEPDAPTPDTLPSHSHRSGCPGKRTLSEVLKLHAEKGTDVHFTSDEAARLEDLLGQWVRIFFPPSFYLPVRGLTFFVASAVVLCGRRSTRAHRHTKGKMNFSQGRMMTRSCSCTAHPPFTLLLDTPSTVRVRVLLSDHSGLTLPHRPTSPSSHRFSSAYAVRSGPPYNMPLRLKVVLTNIDDFVTTFHDTLRTLISRSSHSCFYALSRHLLLSLIVYNSLAF